MSGDIDWDRCKKTFGHWDDPPRDIPDKIFIAALLVSYMPQYVKIFSRKSTSGLSPAFLACNVFFHINSLAIRMMDGDTRFAVACANINMYSLYMLEANLWPLFQHLALLITSMGLLTIYLLFNDPQAPNASPENYFWNKTTRLFTICAALTFWGAFVFIYAAWYMTEHVHLKFYEFNIYIWQAGLFIINIVNTIVLIIPQILLTRRLKGLGSLSLVWLWGQCLAMLWMTVSWHIHKGLPLYNGRSLWWPGLLLFPLSKIALYAWFSLAIYSQRVYWRERQEGESQGESSESEPDSEPGERQPLLHSS